MLICTVGISGSGKTTWAKQQDAKRFSRDDLRELVEDYEHNYKMEKVITEFIEQCVLQNKGSIIIDATNLKLSYLMMYEELANKTSREFFIKEFPCTVNDSLINQVNRERKVGKEILERQYNNYTNLIKNKKYQAYNKL